MRVTNKPAPVSTTIRRASALALAGCLVHPALAQQNLLSAQSHLKAGENSQYLASLSPAAASAPDSTTRDPFAAAFANPPAPAHPRVWWHWMNGNITKEGITQDLEWCIAWALPASRTSTLRSTHPRSSIGA